MEAYPAHVAQVRRIFQQLLKSHRGFLDAFQTAASKLNAFADALAEFAALDRQYVPETVGRLVIEFRSLAAWWAHSAMQVQPYSSNFEIRRDAAALQSAIRAQANAKPPFDESANADFIRSAAAFDQARLENVRDVGVVTGRMLSFLGAKSLEAGAETSYTCRALNPRLAFFNTAIRFKSLNLGSGNTVFTVLQIDREELKACTYHMATAQLDPEAQETRSLQTGRVYLRAYPPDPYDEEGEGRRKKAKKEKKPKKGRREGRSPRKAEASEFSEPPGESDREGEPDQLSGSGGAPNRTPGRQRSYSARSRSGRGSANRAQQGRGRSSRGPKTPSSAGQGDHLSPSTSGGQRPRPRSHSRSHSRPRSHSHSRSYLRPGVSTLPGRRVVDDRGHSDFEISAEELLRYTQQLDDRFYDLAGNPRTYSGTVNPYDPRNPSSPYAQPARAMYSPMTTGALPHYQTDQPAPPPAPPYFPAAHYAFGDTAVSPSGPMVPPPQGSQAYPQQHLAQPDQLAQHAQLAQLYGQPYPPGYVQMQPAVSAGSAAAQGPPVSLTPLGNSGAGPDGAQPMEVPVPRANGDPAATAATVDKKKSSSASKGSKPDKSESGASGKPTERERDAKPDDPPKPEAPVRDGDGRNADTGGKGGSSGSDEGDAEKSTPSDTPEPNRSAGRPANGSKRGAKNTGSGTGQASNHPLHGTKKGDGAGAESPSEERNSPAPASQRTSKGRRSARSLLLGDPAAAHQEQRDQKEGKKPASGPAGSSKAEAAPKKPMHASLQPGDDPFGDDLMEISG